MNKRIEFIRPNLELLPNEDVLDENYCRLRITPLKRGYGMTLGHAIRNVLLNNLPGVAVIGLKLKGAADEYSIVDGIKEDTTEIMLNLKDVAVKLDAVDGYDDEKLYEVKLSVKNKSDEELVVTAGDIDLTCDDAKLEVMNPDKEICTLASGGSIDATLLVKAGVGYASLNENKKFLPKGYFALESIYTPVLRCKYDVAKTRYLDDFACDLVIIEVWTNGVLRATDAISEASKLIVEHFILFDDWNNSFVGKNYMLQPEAEVVESIPNMALEEIENLPSRVYNALKRAQIFNIQELCALTLSQVKMIDGLGAAGIEKMIEALDNYGFKLAEEE